MQVTRRERGGVESVKRYQRSGTKSVSDEGITEVHGLVVPSDLPGMHFN